MKTSKVVSGIAAGAAVGAVIGLLFAPDKGTNTRRKIMQKGNDYKQGIKNQVGNLVETVSSPFHNAANDVNGLSQMAKDKVTAAARK